jgi:MOSC domain-containing protein YiiM
MEAMPLNPASPIAQVINGPIRPGAVEWIGVRPLNKQPVSPRPSAYLEPGKGLVGDHWRGRPDGKRQVTLIQAEHLPVIASVLGLAAVEPAQLRRNLVVRGINLRALKAHRFRVGAAVLELTDECHPCLRMEDILGPGGFNAVRGHGGWCARVLEPGEVRVGDAVARL